jgi:hypothetical protein
MAGLILALAARESVHAADPPVPTGRSLKIAVANNAPPEVKAAAEAIRSATASNPLLTAFAEGHPAEIDDSAALLEGPPQARAFSHLVLVGLPTDLLITAAWQREARVIGGGDFYIFGFGHFSGDIGYIESDRNPFLHSRWIKTAPFETEVVTITGSTPAGVALAAQAFLNEGLINGVVGKGWQRTVPNLLEHDPLAPGFSLPEWVPPQVGDWIRIGVTQAAEDEYRGVLQDTDVAPLEIWRVKYYKPGVWDKPGAAGAFDNYSFGLHRRAYGNSLWIARFSSPEEAAAAMPKIARAAHLPAKGKIFVGKQPPYGFGDDGNLLSLSLWQNGEWLIMSTLPADVKFPLAGNP